MSSYLRAESGEGYEDLGKKTQKTRSLPAGKSGNAWKPAAWGLPVVNREGVEPFSFRIESLWGKGSSKRSRESNILVAHSGSERGRMGRGMSEEQWNTYRIKLNAQGNHHAHRAAIIYPQIRAIITPLNRGRGRRKEGGEANTTQEPQTRGRDAAQTRAIEVGVRFRGKEILNTYRSTGGEGEKRNGNLADPQYAGTSGQEGRPVKQKNGKPGWGRKDLPVSCGRAVSGNLGAKKGEGTTRHRGEN